MFLHGRNFEEDRKENGEETYHIDHKEEVFADINKHFSNYDAIIWTSTMTVGLSFDRNDLIHTFALLCSRGQMPSCIAHYQAIARMRKAEGFTVYVAGNLQRPSRGVKSVMYYYTKVFTNVHNAERYNLDCAIESYKNTVDELGW